jgi:hypothetical protein
MDPETKQLLKDNIDLAQENNILLKKMVRNQKWTNIYRVVYWSIIIFTSVGAYYFIQPLLGNMFNVYGVSDGNNVGDVMKEFSNQQQFKDLLDSIK